MNSCRARYSWSANRQGQGGKVGGIGLRWCCSKEATTDTKRLPDPVTHMRTVILVQERGIHLVRDRLSAVGAHRFEQNFIFENVELKPMAGAGFLPMIVEGLCHARA